MTPNERVNTGTAAAMAISALAGMWLFISPWIYGFGAETIAWNNWVVGALMVVLAAFTVRRRLDLAVVFVVGVLGLWTFCSPWLFHFRFETAHMVNSFVTGAIVFLLAAVAAVVQGRGHHPATPAL